MKIKPALLIAGHGSRESRANREFKKLARQFARKHPQFKVAPGFLELAEPSIYKSLESLALVSEKIRVVPLFLFAAGHMKKDIPAILQSFRQNHPRVRVQLAKELGPDPAMAQLAYERLKPFIEKSRKTLVLVVGRGAKNPSALRDFKKIAGLLAGKVPFQKVQACFFDIARPGFEEALEQAARLNPKRLLIAPYLLFPGKLTQKIKERMKLFSKQHPSIQVHVAEPLGIHPLLFKIMDQRLTKN